MPKSSSEIFKEFFCKGCDYKTSKISNWKKHILTRKHKMVTMDNNTVIMDNKMVTKSSYCCKRCNKSYSHASGLSRHKKKCLKTVKDTKESTTLKIISNNKLINQMETLLEETRVLKNELNNIKSTTTINNTNNLNINVFLNQTCKDAMNLTDFIDKIKHSIEDLDYSGKNGYVKGVSNILIKNLTDIDPHERPLHCSDTKRLKFYIKDNDIWEKDEGNIKMSKSIDDISEKQRLKLKEWREQNPGYELNNRKSEEFFNIVRSIMGGGNEDELTKNKNRIIKSLSTDVSLKSVIADNNIKS